MAPFKMLIGVLDNAAKVTVGASAFSRILTTSNKEKGKEEREKRQHREK